MKKAILVFIAVFILTAPLSAQGQDKQNYLLLKPGLFFFAGDLKDIHHDEGFYGELAYGRYLHKNFVLEAGAGYIHDGIIRGRSDIMAFPVTLTAKVIYPYKNIELLAGGGIGVYFTRFEREVDGFLAYDKDTVYGSHFLIGINMDITSSVYIGSEGRYIFAGESEFQETKADLKGIAVSVNLGYRF